MIDKILIPTDGSKQADQAVERGIELAEAFDAEITALYVIETEATYVLTVGLDDEEMAEYEEYGEEVVSDVVNRASERGLNARGVIKKGKISERIVKYAEDNEFDHIVVGGQGRGAIEKYLGSTAEKVIRMTGVPVTVVSPGVK